MVVQARTGLKLLDDELITRYGLKKGNLNNNRQWNISTLLSSHYLYKELTSIEEELTTIDHNRLG